MSKRISFNFEDDENEENEPPFSQTKHVDVAEPSVIVTGVV